MSYSCQFLIWQVQGSQKSIEGLSEYFLTLWPWPLTLTYQLDLDIIPFDIQAKNQDCMSVRSAVRVVTERHKMSKLFHLSLRDVGCNNASVLIHSQYCFLQFSCMPSTQLSTNTHISNQHTFGGCEWTDHLSIPLCSGPGYHKVHLWKLTEKKNGRMTIPTGGLSDSTKSVM